MRKLTEIIREDSKHIFSCNFDWDEQGGEPVDLTSYQSALNFLLFLDNYNMIGHFELNLCPNGTVDFSLHEKMYYADKSTLINFKKDGSLAYCSIIHSKMKKIEGKGSLDNLWNIQDLIQFIEKYYTNDQETKD